MDLGGCQGLGFQEMRSNCFNRCRVSFWGDENVPLDIGGSYDTVNTLPLNCSLRHGLILCYVDFISIFKKSTIFQTKNKNKLQVLSFLISICHILAKPRSQMTLLHLLLPGFTQLTSSTYNTLLFHQFKSPNYFKTSMNTTCPQQSLNLCESLVLFDSVHSYLF